MVLCNLGAKTIQRWFGTQPRTSSSSSHMQAADVEKLSSPRASQADDATSSTSPRTSRPRRHHRSQAHDARVHHRSRVSWEVWKTYAATRISFPSSPGACARHARTIFCPGTSASKPGGRHSTRGLDAPLSFVVEKAYESIPAFQGQKHPVRGRVLAGI